MSIFDDIAGAFEDLFNEIKKIGETVFTSIMDVAAKVYQAVEIAFRKLEEVAGIVADALNDVGITLSQGVVDGATYAIDFINKNNQTIIDRFKKPDVPEPTPEYERAVSKAIASVFVRIAIEGQEYDVFGILASACNNKDLNYEMLDLGANIAAERLGTDIFNIPRVAPIVVKKELLQRYISFLIVSTVQNNREKVANGKAVQVVTGMIITAITMLVTDGRTADWNWEIPADVTPDPIDNNAPTVWAEGTRLQFNNAIYLVLDGQVRHIPDPETYNSLFANGNNIIISEPGLQNTGRPLSKGTYLVSAPGESKIYLIDDGRKRWISSPQVFKKYAFDNSKIKRIPPAELNKIPTGNTLYQFSKREGAKLIINGAVHVIIDKTARHIPNAETFNQLFRNWNGIQEVDNILIPVGNPLTDRAHLAIARERVYFVNNGQKRWVMSPLAFDNFNFNWDRVKRVSQAELDRIPEGQAIY